MGPNDFGLIMYVLLISCVGVLMGLWSNIKLLFGLVMLLEPCAVQLMHEADCNLFTHWSLICHSD